MRSALEDIRLTKLTEMASLALKFFSFRQNSVHYKKTDDGSVICINSE